MCESSGQDIWNQAGEALGPGAASKLNRCQWLLLSRASSICNIEYSLLSMIARLLDALPQGYTNLHFVTCPFHQLLLQHFKLKG